MYAINTLVLGLAAFTATALAAPRGPKGKEGDSLTFTVSEMEEQCNNNNFGHGKLSCCVKEGDKGLLNLGLLDDLFGTCSQLNLLQISLGGDINNINEICPNEVVCCPGGSKGASCNAMPKYRTAGKGN